MAKRKMSVDHEIWEFAIIILIWGMLTVSLLLVINSWPDSNSETGAESQCTAIPDSKSIMSFCQAQGYSGGWLSSSSCEENEVQCHKTIGEASYYKCIMYQH